MKGNDVPCVRELLLHPSTSLHVLIQPFTNLEELLLHIIFCFNWSNAFYLSSNKNFPHMLCLMISVSSVREPLSRTQLRTINFLEVSFADNSNKNIMFTFQFHNLTIMSWYFYTSRGRKKSTFKFKSFMTEKRNDV